MSKNKYNPIRYWKIHPIYGEIFTLKRQLWVLPDTEEVGWKLKISRNKPRAFVGYDPDKGKFVVESYLK